MERVQLIGCCSECCELPYDWRTLTAYYGRCGAKASTIRELLLNVWITCLTIQVPFCKLLFNESLAAQPRNTFGAITAESDSMAVGTLSARALVLCSWICRGSRPWHANDRVPSHRFILPDEIVPMARRKAAQQPAVYTLRAVHSLTRADVQQNPMDRHWSDEFVGERVCFAPFHVRPPYSHTRGRFGHSLDRWACIDRALPPRRSQSAKGIAPTEDKLFSV